MSAPFRYDDDLLVACASGDRTPTDAPIEWKETQGTTSSAASAVTACRELFRQHAQHYGRRQYNDEDDTTIQDRFKRFVESAVFVYHHNANSDDNSDGDDILAHRVALNKFSDRFPSELPLLADGEAERFMPDYDSLPTLNLEDESQMRSQEGNNHQSLHHGGDNTIFSRVDSESFVRSVSASLGFGFNFGFGKSSHIRNGYGHPRFEDEVSPLPGSTTSSRPVFIWSKKGQKSLYLKRETDEKHTVQKDKMDESDATIDGRDYTEDGDSDFEKELNWSTANNPDGVSLVHPPIDQGSCGSCWAIAATGTVEANAARHRAFETYKDFEREFSKGKHHDHDISDEDRKTAVAAAQDAEIGSFLNLSVQELIDCDVRYDQGCTGGNPLLAFYFIHRYGLTSTKQYPYRGKQKECKADLVMEPVATAQSWGVLTPNHEKNMELVLRYIGPIAVGVNGADPAFLAYEGGIFSSKSCGQNANHAMLIVGYGQKVHTTSGKVTKYWIARNSWGQNWGEDGFVRIKRGSGKKGHRGVCGIARSPSVALGSSILSSTSVAKYKGKQSKHEMKDFETERWRKNRNSVRWSSFGNPNSCPRCHRIFEHVATAAILLSTVFLVAWVATKRRENGTSIRKKDGDINTQEICPLPEETSPPSCSESTALLKTLNNVSIAYGASS